MKYLANSPSLPTELCKYMTHDLCATKVCIEWEGGGFVENFFPGRIYKKICKYLNSNYMNSLTFEQIS